MYILNKSYCFRAYRDVGRTSCDAVKLNMLRNREVIGKCDTKNLYARNIRKARKIMLV